MTNTRRVTFDPIPVVFCYVPPSEKEPVAPAVEEAEGDEDGRIAKLIDALEAIKLRIMRELEEEEEEEKEEETEVE